MRWHHPSGLGVIALTNHRYGPGVPLARDILNELLRSTAVPIRRMTPNRPTEDARTAVEALIERWDDQRAAALFAMNVELDEPIADRRATLERIRARHGALRRDETEPDESQTPFHLAWWMTGNNGRVRLEILLTPELPPKVQTFAVTSVPEPPEDLRRAAGRIVAALASPESGPITIDWPAGLKVGTSVDLGAVVRSMRATEARLGEVHLGRPIAGDGETKATFRLDSPRGRADLVLEFDPEVRCLSAVSLVPARLVPPDLD
jgi:hypothetical protein